MVKVLDAQTVGMLYIGVKLDDGEIVETFVPAPHVSTINISDIEMPVSSEFTACLPVAIFTTVSMEDSRNLRAVLDPNYRCSCAFPRVQRRFPDVNGVTE